MQFPHSAHIRRWTISRCRRGTTVVEFSICLPLVLLLFFGSIEFGRVNMLRHTCAQAAYEGARRGIVPGATADDVRNAATSILSTAFASTYTVNVVPATIEPNTAEVTVSIAMPIASNCWCACFFFGGKTLTHSFTLQREQNAIVTVP
jgi:Flp pilus assembly protein TadG